MPDSLSEAQIGAATSKNPEYLFVDLDGTLVRTDVFVEAILKLIKKNPLNIFRLILWGLKGRAVLKSRVARTAKLDPHFLPYEAEMVDYIKEQKAQGRKIILATASHWTYAKRIAAHLGLFDGVMASSAKKNLKGRRKLAEIQDSLGGAPFAYAGDSPADRPIWDAAASAVHVNARAADVKSTQSRNACEKVISTRKSIFAAFIKEMRLHQWAKNVLVFVPLLTAHSYLNMGSLLQACLAFLCFSLCASGVYFLNDLLDLEADRQHTRKRFRPLASGDLPIFSGLMGAVGLPVTAFVIAGLTLPMAFFGVLGIYYLITNLYSFFLKRVSTADVMTLAVLYTMRVVAGGAATGIVLSSWLMAFSVFIFVSLAYLKRYIEVSALSQDKTTAAGRGYAVSDSETMFGLGIANTTAAVLVLALYINSDDVAGLYASPQILWLLCFLLLYWTNRIWIGARRGKIADDPVVFAIKDNVSRLVGVCFLMVVLAAKFIPIEGVM